MDSAEFREFGRAAVDYFVDYFENIRDKIQITYSVHRQVLSSVEPGYLQPLLSEAPPVRGEQWQSILQDIDKIITPGLTHWHSPNFHAYYPTANSYPGIVGELVLSGLGATSTDTFPDTASTELETKMMDWLARMLNLPSHFLKNGLIQNAASEATLVALLAAKNRHASADKLVAYSSEQSNSSVEKSGLLASVTMKLLPTNEEGSLRSHTLLQAITKDIQAGYTPCCVVATLGTTGTCAFDNLLEIGPICQKFGVWLHVDAAYAGSAFVCPEYRYLMDGVVFADSFSINPHKWLLVNSDCSAMWFKDGSKIEKQIPDERRFRALKLWFVLRIYGVEGVRKHIRGQIGLARYFEELIKMDNRFEVCTSSMGLVCFRLRGGDDLTQKLLARVIQRKNIFIMPYYYQNKLVIRFVICSRFTEKSDILYAWEEIKSQVGSNLAIFKGNYAVAETITKENHVTIS